MLILLLSLIALGIVAAVVTLLSNKKGGEEPIVQPPVGNCATCNGQDPRCEQECMMEASTKPLEYFDDEELDAYRGRPSDSYTDEETAQFAEVLETLRSEEVKAWNRSLILRGINMPDGIKDEFIALTE